MADEDIDLGEMMRDVGDTVTGTYNFSGNPLEFIRMIDFDDTITTPAHSEGRVFYDKTDNTLCYYNNEADVTMNLGQEGWVYARNITGSTILDGKIVYITGAVSSRPTIALAQADAEATSKLIGVATHDIETATNGYVTVWGVVRGIDLSDFSDGDEVFLSAAVAGSLTATAPSAPNYVVEVGYVIDASANGDLLVSTGKSKMLNSLGDVLISGPTTGDILVYDGTAWADSNSLTAASPNFTGTMTADSAQFDGNVDMDSLDVNGAANFGSNITVNGKTITGDEYWIFDIFSPNLVYDDDTQISIDPRTSAALTVTRIDVTLDADPTTELEYSIKFADAFIGLANATIIEDTATVAGVTTVTSITGDATVPTNKAIYIQFEADPDANITQVSVKVTWDYD